LDSAVRVELCEELGPRARGCVSVANRGHFEGPGDREVGIVISHGEIFCRIMQLVNPIANVGIVGQSLEAVQEARGHIEMPEQLVIEPKCLGTAKGGRVWASIDDDIVNGAACAAHKLCLTTAGPAVKTAQYSLPGPRLGVLDKGSRVKAMGVGGLSVEGAGEETSVVVSWGGNKKENASDRCVANLHVAMMTSHYAGGL
jgi:hypothetical protein